MSSTSTVGMSRSSEEHYGSDPASGSNLRLVPSPGSMDQYSDYDSPPMSAGSSAPRYESPVPRAAANVRTIASPTSSFGDPFRPVTMSPTNYDEQHPSLSPAESEPETATRSQSAAGHRARGRHGVRLTDSGPVPGPEGGVRRVSKPGSKRPTSQAPQNRYSRNSTNYSLPPGAAPPQY